MSVSPFRDTVTLWHYVGSGGGMYIRRVVSRVKCTVTEKSGGGGTAVLYIPIYGKREIRYVSPGYFSALVNIADTFTVSAGDRFVYGVSAAGLPPSDALTAAAVTVRDSGSRRMRHIEVRGERITEKSDEGGTT